MLEVTEAGEKLGSKPIIIGILDLRDGVLQVMLKVVSIVTPDGIGTDQENAAYSE